MKRKLALSSVMLSLILGVSSSYALPQNIERSINEGVKNYKTEIRFNPQGTNMNEVSKFLYEGKFYNIDSLRIGGNSNQAILYLKYFENKEDMERVERLASLISKEVEGYDIKEKVYYITQRISKLITYEEVDDTVIFSPTTAVKDNIGVCQAYARLANIIFDKSGIHNVFVEGTVNGGTPHLWNAVEIDGEWYSVDITSADMDESEKVNFKYLFMNKEDLKEEGYTVTSSPKILSNRKIQEFDGIGLVSLKDNRIYTKMIEGSNTIFSLNYKNRNLEVVSSAEDYWVAGGKLFGKVDGSLKNYSDNIEIYQGITESDVLDIDESEIKVNNKTVYNTSHLPLNRVFVVNEDFKVIVNDLNFKDDFIIEEGSNKTNVFFNNKFLIQYIRNRR